MERKVTQMKTWHFKNTFFVQFHFLPACGILSDDRIYSPF